jgi:predicted N-formylglutamate amidohydrolase
MKSRISAVVVTCEHATPAVPREYAHLFAGRQQVLRTHRGYDRGALEAAQHFARAFAAPLLTARMTRLVIDMNRTVRRRSLFSFVTRSLPRAERLRLIHDVLEPHHERVRAEVARAPRGTVLHLGIHSFTPVRLGRKRHTDIGLLYDPARPGELAFARAWERALRRAAPRLRVRRNYPFLGKNLGLTGGLRQRFPGPRYLGIELEINQRFVRRGGPPWRRLVRLLAATAAEALAAV